MNVQYGWYQGKTTSGENGQKKGDIMIQRVSQADEIALFRDELICEIARREIEHHPFMKWLSWFDDRSESFGVKLPNISVIALQRAGNSPIGEIVHPVFNLILQEIVNEIPLGEIFQQEKCIGLFTEENFDTELYSCINITSNQFNGKGFSRSQKNPGVKLIKRKLEIQLKQSTQLGDQTE